MCKKWLPGPRYSLRTVHGVHDIGIKEANIGLKIILPQVANMPRLREGVALEGLQSICTGADLRSDLVRTFPVGS